MFGCTKQKEEECESKLTQQDCVGDCKCDWEAGTCFISEDAAAAAGDDYEDYLFEDAAARGAGWSVRLASATLALATALVLPEHRSVAAVVFLLAAARTASAARPSCIAADSADLKAAVHAVTQPSGPAAPAYDFANKATQSDPCPIAEWDTSRVTAMDRLFEAKTNFVADLSRWDVARVVTMKNMFYDAAAFTSNLAAWDVGKVVNMESMFFQATAFDGDVSTWDVSRVTTMTNMFAFASSFSCNLARWNVANVRRAKNMFMGASAFNGDVSTWDVAGMVTMANMFYGAHSFDGNLGAWKIGTNAETARMFEHACSFSGRSAPPAFAGTTFPDPRTCHGRKRNAAGSAGALVAGLVVPMLLLLIGGVLFWYRARLSKEGSDHTAVHAAGAEKIMAIEMDTSFTQRSRPEDEELDEVVGVAMDEYEKSGTNVRRLLTANK